MKRFFCVAALVLLVAILRQPARFTAISFWNEDGYSFFVESVELGWKAAFLPVYGHFHLIARLLALGSSFFPTYYSPYLYAGAAGIVSAFSFAIFSRNEYRWIVRSDAARCVFCVAMTLLPGSWEIFFTLCELNYSMLLAALLIILARDENGQPVITFRRTLLVTFLFFSAGASIVLAPVLVLLYHRTKQTDYLGLLVFLAASVAANTAALLGRASAIMPPYVFPDSLLRMIDSYSANLSARLILHPLFGLGGMLAAGNAAPWLPHALTAVAVPAVLALAIRRNSKNADLAFTACSVMIIYPLTSAVRYYAGSTHGLAALDFEFRYAFIGAFLAALLFCRLADETRRLASGAAALGVSGLLLVNLPQHPVVMDTESNYVLQQLWPAQAEQIDRALALRRSGALPEPVNVGGIYVRPSEWFTNMGLTISPDYQRSDVVKRLPNGDPVTERVEP